MNDELKSAVELAMEKLDAGGDTIGRLSDDQKEEIADIRSRYRARIAQEEINLQSEIRKRLQTGDAEGAQEVVERVRAEKRRLEEKMESEVAKVHDQAES